jgi:uncharacterized repeat protein (TIGR01451 family)
MCTAAIVRRLVAESLARVAARPPRLWRGARPQRMRVLLASVVFALFGWASPGFGAYPSSNWSQVNQNGFVAGQTATSEGSKLFVFDSKLYAYNEFGLFRMDDPGTKVWTGVTPPAQPGGPGATPLKFIALGNYLYAYDSGQLWWIAQGQDLTGSNWHLVTSTGLPGGASPKPFVVFSSKIYGVYLTTSSGPFEIWRSGDIGAANATWERVVQNSFGDPTSNTGVDVMIVFNGKIVAGTDTLGPGSFGDPANFGQGVEVWESASGDSGSWSQVNVDGFGTMYPSPPCYSPTLCTFPIHQVIGSAAVYQAPGQGQPYLYIGTKSHFGAEVWRYNGNGNPATGWTNVTQPWMGPCQIGCGPGRNEAMAVFQNALWVAEGYPTADLDTFDGTNWSIEVTGPNPFDTHNGGLMSLALFQSGLFVGTLHDFGDYSQGDQVWRYLYSPAVVTASKTILTPSYRLLPNYPIQYQVVLTNTSDYDQLDNPGDEFTDPLPTGLTLTGASATSGTTTTSANTVHWNGSITAHASVTITIDAKISDGTYGTNIVNQATVNYDVNGDGSNSGSTLAAAGFTVNMPIPALTKLGLVLLTALIGVLAALVLFRRR